MIRELNELELDLISGGLQDGYQYCPNGPAGGGVYPSYVDCGGQTLGDVIIAGARKCQEILHPK
jgi:hypothetical protein